MRIAIYGAGSWGTALACMLHQNGHQISLWSRKAEHVVELRQTRENKPYLPGILLPQEIAIDCDYSLGLDAELVIFAVPAAAVRDVALAAAPYFRRDAVLVNVAKGFAPDSLLRLSQVIGAILPGHPVLTLSGPSHAEEAVHGLPTTVVIAGNDLTLLQKVQDVFMSETFRVYPNTDQVGVEVGGAVKNIIGLGAGVLDGLQLGDNAKAALITRGLAEIKRLGVAMGAVAATFSGLTGVGDLIVTCTSMHSRNFRAGREIGQGKALSEVLGGTMMVVEGVYAAQATYKLAQKYGVEMPITEQIYKILYENLAPQEAMRELMTRAKTSEE
jgi:glycerol-3-phosphate dehydrogenase (NAD(P)+)